MTCPDCSPAFDLRHIFAWSPGGYPARMHPNYSAELTALRSGLPPVTTLPVGSLVRITAPGRYAGQTGTVVRRGRSLSSTSHLAVSLPVRTGQLTLCACTLNR